MSSKEQKKDEKLPYEFVPVAVANPGPIACGLVASEHVRIAAKLRREAEEAEEAAKPPMHRKQKKQSKAKEAKEEKKKQQKEVYAHKVPKEAAKRCKLVPRVDPVEPDFACGKVAPVVYVPPVEKSSLMTSLVDMPPAEKISASIVDVPPVEKISLQAPIACGLVAKPAPPRIACGKRAPQPVPTPVPAPVPAQPQIACGMRAPQPVYTEKKVQKVEPQIACGKRAPKKVVDKVKPRIACGKRAPKRPTVEAVSEKAKPQRRCGKKAPQPFGHAAAAPKIACGKVAQQAQPVQVQPAPSLKMAVACGLVAKRPQIACGKRAPAPVSAAVRAPQATEEKVQTPSCLSFSVDLVPSAVTVLNDIEAFASQKDLHGEECLQRSLHRYELFLGILAEELKQGGKEAAVKLVPPPDVAHVWRAHLIRQNVYRSDCQTLFGVPFLPTDVLFSEQYVTLAADDAQRNEKEIARLEAVKASRKRWNAYVKAKELPRITYEPVRGDAKDEETDSLPAVGIDLRVVHLKEDIRWWGDFQFWAEEYAKGHEAFFERRLDTYKQFLIDSGKDIRKDNFGPGMKTEGPPVDVDHLWHVHMMFCDKYDADLMANIGVLFYHRPQADPEYNA